MPLANQDAITRLARVISRLELTADKLGAANAPMKKYQSREMLPQLVLRIEKAASFLDDKSVPSSFFDSKSFPCTSGERRALQKTEKVAENRVKLAELVSRFETSTPERKEASSTTDGRKAVEQFDKVMKGKLEVFLDLSDQLGGEIKTQAHVVKNAFKAQRDFILKSTKTKRPNEEILAALLRKTSQQMEKVEDCKDKGRDRQAFNHLSAVNEGTGSLGWVTADGNPSDFVKKKSDDAQVYLDRVLKDFYTKDRKHLDWVRAFQGVLGELNEYVKDVFPAGLTWAKL